MNQKEYFAELGRKSWEKRKKTMTPEKRKKLAEMGQKGLKKKIASLKNNS